MLKLTAGPMTETGAGPAEVVGRQSWNLTDFAFSFTTPQMALGLKPQPQTRPALLIDRSRMPPAIPEAVIHASIPALTQSGTGMVRVTTVLLKASLGSEQYHSMNSLIA